MEQAQDRQVEDQGKIKALEWKLRRVIKVEMNCKRLSAEEAKRNHTKDL